MSDTQRNPSDVAMERFVEQKLTRREALRKMGITSGTALLMFIGVDNLARLTADKMREHEATREIGETVAREFRSVGAAWADTPYSGGPSSPSQPAPSGGWCDWCYRRWTNIDMPYCVNVNEHCMEIHGPNCMEDECNCSKAYFQNLLICLSNHGCPPPPRDSMHTPGCRESFP